jgi:hypothetical protein
VRDRVSKPVRAMWHVARASASRPSIGSLASTDGALHAVARAGASSFSALFARVGDSEGSDDFGTGGVVGTGVGATASAGASVFASATVRSRGGSSAEQAASIIAQLKNAHA